MVWEPENLKYTSSVFPNNFIKVHAILASGFEIRYFEVSLWSRVGDFQRHATRCLQEFHLNLGEIR